jgi:uncharacterized protein YbjQ (UPF0145 family)
MSKILLCTAENLPDRRVRRTLGLVRGNAVRARHIGRDLWAFARNLTGGELDDYTKLLGEVREQALDRMLAEARVLGADAVVALRFQSCEIANGAAEMLAYGTAVELEPEGGE